MLSKLIHRLRHLGLPATSPFVEGVRKPIVHASHHKMGSTWMANVLEGVSKRFDLDFQRVNEPESFDPERDVTVVNHSDIVHGLDKDVHGSHMVRDLRDVVVSGYFYHLWTKEAWAHVPMPSFDGKTYQEHLNSLDQEQGLLAEIDWLARYARERKMWDWNYDDPRFLEIKYEKLFENQSEGFHRLFTHYGFTSDAVGVSVKIAEKFNFQRLSKRKPGQEATKTLLRSGVAGQWRQHFKPMHVERFKLQLGELLIRMGYETDNNW